MNPSAHRLFRNEGFRETDLEKHQRKNGGITLVTQSFEGSQNAFQHLNPEPTQSAQPGMVEALLQHIWQPSPKSSQLQLAQS
jgi:hypothetical protein